MFPFRDHNLSSTVPYVTLALIAVNVVVFLLTLPALHGGPAQLQLYSDWALIPARATAGQDWGTVLTAMFLHGGWLHIFGNMLFLWIFGDNVEDAFGHLGFLLFYLACGVAASGAQIAADPSSTVPMVGASGAIAGVMGGYLLLYPKARVDVLIVIVIMIRLMVIPAWVVLGIWFGLQALAEFATDPAHGGVAYSAHVGGFLAGIALTLPLWLARGGTALWRSTGGRPDHPETGGGLHPSVFPVVRRRKLS